MAPSPYSVASKSPFALRKQGKTSVADWTVEADDGAVAESTATSDSDDASSLAEVARTVARSSSIANGTLPSLRPSRLKLSRTTAQSASTSGYIIRRTVSPLRTEA